LLHPSHHLVSLLRPEPSEGESLFEFFTYAVNDGLRIGIQSVADVIASGFDKALVAVEVVYRASAKRITVNKHAIIRIGIPLNITAKISNKNNPENDGSLGS
jgi:hypothetical protein